MKKLLLITMLAGAACTFQACNTGSSSTNGVDSVKNVDVPSNRDTSKTTTNIGGATVLDNSSSGGVTTSKGVPSTSKTMDKPVPLASPKADTAKTGAPTDSVKKP
jgi:ABC-type oligopeptide transport system substrate-binding subunit